MASAESPGSSSIKAIDKTSIHRITSGQVIVDLQTAVKELVENSLDAGATAVEVRFKHYGLTSVEVIDNGCGIAEKDWESVGLKHYTSKLTTFDDLSIVRTFGFRGEAVSSLCALCDNVVVTTATEGSMGIQLDLEHSGRVGKKTKVARQRGTTVMFTRLFASLPVRRKELQRNIKREFGKALGLLNAYALGPCTGMDSSGRGVRLNVINQTENGQKIPQIKTEGVSSFRASLAALWGSKAMDNTVDLDLELCVQREKSVARKITDKYSRDAQSQSENDSIPIRVKGLISKFAVGCGRTGTDRQFFYVNGRPCNLTKIQKAFNEVYRSFNANQSPFILADFIVPTECCDINVSPDKRTIFMQGEQNLIDVLKDALKTAFSSHSSTFDVNGTQPTQNALSQIAFDSPFSKRLSIKSAKSGGSTPKSQTKPQKDAPQERRLPLADSDSGRGEGLQNETSAPRLPPVNEPENMPRPVTKRIEQLLKASSSRGKARSADETSRTDDPGLGQRSLQSSKEVQLNSSSSVDVESMDVDQPSDRERTREEEVSKTIVVDTSKAIWNKLARKESALEKHVDKGPESVEDAEGPVAKKRRMEVGGDQVTTDQPVTKAGTARKSTTVENLRNRLARYASGGSQVPNANDGESALDEDRMIEDEDEDESANQTRKNAKKGTKSSDVAVALRIQEATTGKDGRKNKGAPQKPIEVDEDEDVLMNDDIEPSTSSTIGVSETQTAKVIELDIDQGSLSVPRTSGGPSHQKDVGQRPEIIRNPEIALGNGTIRFDLEQLKNKWESRRKGLPTNVKEATCTSRKISADASLTNTEDNESATRALERVIDKTDFANMDILGQFNLGFIIVRRRKRECDEEGNEGAIMDDLFIVDQHAADEKYNFETLQQTTRVQSQKLFKPRPLELTAADELVAIENVDVLRENGFELVVDEMAAAGQGTRLQVTAFPVSKSTEFDMKDLEELIHLMRDQPTGRMVRCSKARAMFAMRACRKSVMIGMALNQSQMTTVVQHMGTIDQPWNCPHGRPTMRHLIDLCQTGLQSPTRTINWSGLNDIS